jgi:hypothetical protein
MSVTVTEIKEGTDFVVVQAFKSPMQWVVGLEIDDRWGFLRFPGNSFKNDSASVLQFRIEKEFDTDIAITDYGWQQIRDHWSGIQEVST